MAGETNKLDTSGIGVEASNTFTPETDFSNDPPSSFGMYKNFDTLRLEKGGVVKSRPPEEVLIMIKG